jgi:hypothetical protein
MAKAGARKQAMLSGERQYFTGTPCKHGHLANRYVSTKACVVCAGAFTKAWNAENLSAILARNKQWREANPERVKRQRHNRYLANQPYYFAASKRKKAALKDRVPPWADLGAMREMYAEAKMRRENGDDVVVDHVIPLNGETVCGLHVHTNLQIIGARENRIKSNLLIEGTW